MKGIAHFSMGVAIASCVPGAVQQALQGNGWPIVLGGVAGLLPDTLDFRINRHFATHDVDIIPDPLKPDPAIIALGISWAVERCAAMRRSVRVRLRAIRLASDRWQSYLIRFDPAKRKVIAEYGPVVDPGGNPVWNEAAVPCKTRLRADAKVRVDVKVEYEAELTVAGFDGALLSLEPVADGRVAVGFLPWHRKWSHSLFFAVSVGLFSWLVGGGIAGVAAALACAAHALTDHAGFMGSNLFFPFTFRRAEGFKLLHSSDFFPNVAAVWISWAVIFLNLGVYSQPRPFATGMAYCRALIAGGVAPVVFLGYFLKRIKQNSTARKRRSRPNDSKGMEQIRSKTIHQS